MGRREGTEKDGQEDRAEGGRRRKRGVLSSSHSPSCLLSTACLSHAFPPASGGTAPTPPRPPAHYSCTAYISIISTLQDLYISLLPSQQPALLNWQSLGLLFGRHCARSRTSRLFASPHRARRAARAARLYPYLALARTRQVERTWARQRRALQATRGPSRYRRATRRRRTLPPCRLSCGYQRSDASQPTGSLLNALPRYAAPNAAGVYQPPTDNGRAFLRRGAAAATPLLHCSLPTYFSCSERYRRLPTCPHFCGHLHRTTDVFCWLPFLPSPFPAAQRCRHMRTIVRNTRHAARATTLNATLATGAQRGRMAASGCRHTAYRHRYAASPYRPRHAYLRVAGVCTLRASWRSQHSPQPPVRMR